MDVSDDVKEEGIIGVHSLSLIDLSRFDKGDLHSLVAAYFDILQERLIIICEMW
jgi:hypothetical protein